MQIQLIYGNWIRTKKLLILGLLPLGMGIIFFLPIAYPYRLPLTFLLILLLINFLFPLYAYIMFSPRGGHIQDKVYYLVIASLGEKVQGKILDIGTGNGVLAVKLAQRHSAVEVTAIDYWGEDWEYSQDICEHNARVGDVTGRVHFQKGNAAALDFLSGTFDGAVSNLTFHEVKSVDDKREVVREALRVVKPDGLFSFVDYFYEPKFYGDALEFERYLKGLGLTQVTLEPLHQKMHLNLLLRHPRLLGRVGILCGRK
jgi:ubiquinone/menaquinone biosynthesis C-methylase UbiE